MLAAFRPPIHLKHCFGAKAPKPTPATMLRGYLGAIAGQDIGLRLALELC